ncbi:ATP-binding cassette domain-containing protein [Candidatus Sumerlaeota bacterium]|nr:ATP-binding cassette domain-containing protein [Candidatus Sumerlaeota bacterium]
MTVGHGEHVALNGPSGCGKTTLLRCVLGFATPDAGAIRVDGEALDARTVWELRQRIAYVPQSPEFGDGTVEEVLHRPFAYKANAALAANVSRAPELLKRLRLPDDAMSKQTGDLSGGEKQRLALVVALLLERKMLLLDEPTAALDGEAKAAALELLREQSDMAILSVSHDEALRKTAARVVNISTPKEP